MKKIKGLIIVLMLVFLPALAFGAGFKIPEQDAKAMGMGLAFTAQADNPSAVYYNPAGLTQLTGTQIRGGATYIIAPGADFSGTYNSTIQSASGKDQSFLIPNIYLVSDLNTKDFRFGIGIFSPFGLSRKYEEANAIFVNRADAAQLKTIYVNPVVAYRVNNYLSLGAGVSYVHSDVILATTVYGSGATQYQFHADGSGDGIGFNFGATIKPNEQFQIGLNYRSSTEIKYDGQNQIHAISAAAIAGFGGAYSFDSISSKVKLPDSATLAVAYKPIKDLTVEADINWNNWSTYKKLPFEVSKSNAILTAVGYTTVNLSKDKNWKDTWSFAVGANYKFLGNYAVRGGYSFDKTPIPESTLGPELPDSDRHLISLGLGYERNKINADLGYMLVLFENRSVNNTTYSSTGTVTSTMVGTWKSRAHLLGLSLGYKF